VAFDIKDIPNSALRSSDVPKDAERWAEFALTFDAYKHHGSYEACATIANRKTPKTLTDYRTCLFFEQRRYRHLDADPDDAEVEYIESLLDGIRIKIMEKAPLNAASKYVGTEKSLQQFRPVLNKWIELNELLVRRWSEVGDVPWWYNERASVSVFAGAIWKTGDKDDYAFEEYAIEKPLGKKPCAGRIDMEFSLKGTLFIAEAKQCWMNPRNAERVNRIKKHLDRAIADVERCDSHGMRRLGITFGIPCFKETNERQLRGEIARFTDDAQTVEADALAWVFPKLSRLPMADGLIYPGIAIWIKESGRDSRFTPGKTKPNDNV